jgi:hypothetical protein
MAVGISCIIVGISCIIYVIFRYYNVVMKPLIASLSLLLFFLGCAPKNHCTLSSRYLSKIDTTKPYDIKGLYCIASLKDTILTADRGAITFRAFDRLSGRKINEGVVWLIKGDTTKMYLNKQEQLPIGVYKVFVDGLENMPLKIDKFNITKNCVYEVNCFLGNRMSF